VPFEPLGDGGALVERPKVFPDSRGSFCELMSTGRLEAESGYAFRLAQVNLSRSSRGVIRGVHFAQRPPGQAKYVMCLDGEVWDVVVDLRQESPSFGEWYGVTLRGAYSESVFVPEGFGHGFCVVSQHALVAYATSSDYDPAAEYTLSPFDPDLDIRWPEDMEHVVSERDERAPSLKTLRMLQPEVFRVL
jgi:dTDP-4-dehydrorhamnose 3,5-epimerase